MTLDLGRRRFLGATGAVAGLPLLGRGPVLPPQEPAKFKLGTITYNIGAAWDVPTLLQSCKAAGFGFVELRTTHAHKVEPDLPAERRAEVRKQFEDAGIKLWSFGTVCEFQSGDPAVVARNVEDCRAFCKLASDVGAPGVKVRPNGIPKGADLPRTLEQIGAALQLCGKAAADHGVEIWVEVHGAVTQTPANMRAILDACRHPSVGICWNSNPTDVKDGSIKESFDLLKKDIRSVHINELWSGYPYRQLFSELKGIGYDRVTFMECAGVPEAPNAKGPDAAIRFMRYYKALWTELCR